MKLSYLTAGGCAVRRAFYAPPKVWLAGVVLVAVIRLPGAVSDFRDYAHLNDPETIHAVVALHWLGFSLWLLLAWLGWGIGRLICPVVCGCAALMRRGARLVPWDKAAGVILAGLVAAGAVAAKVGGHAGSLGRSALPALEHAAPSVEHVAPSVGHTAPSMDWTPYLTVPFRAGANPCNPGYRFGADGLCHKTN